jgi:hypothetical protein
MAKFTKRVLLALATSALCTMSVDAIAKERCTKPNAAQLSMLEKHGIVQICKTFMPRVTQDPLQIPTRVITRLLNPLPELPLPLPEGSFVVWAPETRTARFMIPDKPQFKDYSICKYWTEQVSTIPKPGKYLKHGFERLTPRSIDYGWYLADKGDFKGDTKLNADVKFSFLPTANLEDARKAGLCMTDKQLSDGAKIKWR